jgi:hypothetical protein
MSTTALPADNPLDPNSAALGEQAWIEVIQKMDEVYNDLLQYEVALEDKNAALEESQQFIESVLGAMSSILYVSRLFSPGLLLPPNILVFNSLKLVIPCSTKTSI